MPDLSQLVGRTRQPPRRDSRGVEIKPDQTVAYNRSGDVIEGQVISVTPWTVTIMPHYDFQQGRNDSRLSRVRNPRGILVLKEAP